MSVGFGWSLSDVALLANVIRKVVKALNEDDGAKVEYQRVMKSLRDLEGVLNEIRSILSKVDTVFGNALRGQLDLSTSSIGTFYKKLVNGYGKSLSGDEPLRRTKGFSKKVSWALLKSFSGDESLRRTKGFSKKLSWAFLAAEELSQFRQQLSDQLNTVKFLMITHIWCGFLQPLKVHSIAKRLEYRQTAAESKEQVTASHALVQDLFNTSALNSRETRLMLVELKTLLTPYLDTARNLRETRSLTCRDINRTSQSALSNDESRLETAEIASEASSEEAPISDRSTMLDRSALMDHLTVIRNMQLQSTNAQRCIENSVDTIRTELSNVLFNENAQMRRNLQEQGELFTMMSQSFEGIRLTMQELAQSQRDKSSKAELVTRQSSHIPLHTSTEVVSNQSVPPLLSVDPS